MSPLIWGRNPWNAFFNSVTGKASVPVSPAMLLPSRATAHERGPDRACGTTGHSWRTTLTSILCTGHIPGLGHLTYTHEEGEDLEKRTGGHLSRLEGSHKLPNVETLVVGRLPSLGHRIAPRLS